MMPENENTENAAEATPATETVVETAPETAVETAPENAMASGSPRHSASIWSLPSAS